MFEKSLLLWLLYKVECSTRMVFKISTARCHKMFLISCNYTGRPRVFFNASLFYLPTINTNCFFALTRSKSFASVREGTVMWFYNSSSSHSTRPQRYLKSIACSQRKPPALPRSPHIKMARWPKTPVEFGKVYWRRQREHDKTGERVVFVVCLWYIRCIYRVRR